MSVVIYKHTNTNTQPPVGTWGHNTNKKKRVVVVRTGIRVVSDGLFDKAHEAMKQCDEDHGIMVLPVVDHFGDPNGFAVVPKRVKRHTLGRVADDGQRYTTTGFRVGKFDRFQCPLPSRGHALVVLHRRALGTHFDVGHGATRIVVVVVVVVWVASAAQRPVSWIDVGFHVLDDLSNQFVPATVFVVEQGTNHTVDVPFVVLVVLGVAQRGWAMVDLSCRGGRGRSRAASATTNGRSTARLVQRMHVFGDGVTETVGMVVFGMLLGLLNQCSFHSFAF